MTNFLSETFAKHDLSQQGHKRFGCTSLSKYTSPNQNCQNPNSMTIQPNLTISTVVENDFANHPTHHHPQKLNGSLQGPHMNIYPPQLNIVGSATTSRVRIRHNERQQQEQQQVKLHFQVHVGLWIKI